MNFNKKFFFAASALMVASTPALAQGQSASAASTPALRGYAAPSFQVPTGFGASWGSVGFGVYGQTCDGCNDDDIDGSAAAVVGFGNAQKYVGVEVSATSSSLFGDGGSGESFGEVGSLGVKLHTDVPGGASFAVGVTGTGRWGTNPNRSSVYAAASKFFDMGSLASIVTVGLGDNLFNDPGETGANVFGSASLYFTPQISVVAEYTGRFTNAVVSVAPFRSLPFSISAGAVNLGERFGASTEFAASVGYGFTF